MKVILIPLDTNLQKKAMDEDEYGPRYAIVLSELTIREKEKYYELLLSHNAKLQKVSLIMMIFFHIITNLLKSFNLKKG